jgi:hypothetical protein
MVRTASPPLLPPRPLTPAPSAPLIPQDEEDDPIISEIPVVLSDIAASDHMYVLQYPLRPIQRPHDKPDEARVKWENQMLELVHNRDKDPEHFDRNAPPQRHTEKLVMQSAKVPCHTHYAVGRLDGGVLHLAPVKRVLQMRPSLGHIDRTDAAEKAAAAAAAAEPGATADIKPTSKQLQVMYKKKETDRAVQAKLESFAHKNEVQGMEPWAELSVHDSESAESVAQSARLLGGSGAAGMAGPGAPAAAASSSAEQPTCWDMSSAQYLESMRYHDPPPAMDVDPRTTVKTEAT